MILAAGFGTRLRPYTLERPKPLFPVLGRPLLLIIIERLRRAGFSPIIVNCHYLSEQISTLLAAEEDVIVQEERAVLGTGGGLRAALTHMASEPLLVTCGDIYHDIDYGEVYRGHLEGGASVSMVFHDYPRFNQVAVGADGLVKGFPARGHVVRDAGYSLRAFTGVHIVDPQVLEGVPAWGFSDIIDRYISLIDQGVPIKALESGGSFWRDIGTAADYLELHGELLTRGERPSSLSLLPGSRFYGGADLQHGSGLTLKEWGVIGRGVCLGRDVTLERVVIWDGAVVADGFHLRECIVTSACP